MTWWAALLLALQPLFARVWATMIRTSGPSQAQLVLRCPCMSLGSCDGPWAYVATVL